MSALYEGWPLLLLMALFDVWGGAFWFRWWRGGLPLGRHGYAVPAGLRLPNSPRLSYFPGSLALRLDGPDQLLFRDRRVWLLPFAPVHGSALLAGRTLQMRLHLGWTGAVLYGVLFYAALLDWRGLLLISLLGLKDWWWYRRVLSQLDEVVAFCQEYGERPVGMPQSQVRSREAGIPAD